MTVKTRAPSPSTFLAKAARLKVFGKSPVGFYLRLNQIDLGDYSRWPAEFISCAFIWGVDHNLVRLHATRQQYFGTFFLRNRPALEMMRHLAEKKAKGSTLRLQCSPAASARRSIRSSGPYVRRDQI